MKLRFKHGVFWIKLGIASRRPEGFRWSIKRKLFYTENPYLAAKYTKYAIDSRTRDQLRPIATNIHSSLSESANIDPPAPPGQAYLPFQKAGIAYALNVLSQDRGVLIADQMGLGKTVESMGVINSLMSDSVLIVCPASVKDVWRKAFDTWALTPIEAGVAYGNTSFPNTGAVIINYDILSRFDNEICRQVWDMLILDEAHYIKNSKAIRSQFVKKIRAKHKLALTGTPITNRPKDIFNIVRFCDPKLFPNFFKFANRYCDAHRGEYGWIFDGASNLSELNNVLRANIMVRRKKEDVLKELPPRLHQIINLPKDKVDIKRAINKETEVVRALKSQVNDLKINLDAVDFSQLAEIRHETALTKIPLVVEYLKNITDKVVCFAWHTDVIKGIAKHFKNSVTVTGSTPDRKRAEYVSRFQKDPGTQYFFGNIIAAGTGITLTASSFAVFVEMDWTPGNMAQAADRLHRIGQLDCVNVQYLVFDDSLDAHMAKYLIERQKVIDEATDGNKKILDDVLKNY